MKQTKICPRCGEKTALAQRVCPYCGLSYVKLSSATNKEAKKAIREKRREYIVMTSNLPPDVKLYKALLFCGFLGLFGGHNFYLGRYLKATLVLVITALTAFFASLTIYPESYDSFMYLFSIPGSIPMIFWVYDFILLSTGRYKIPVALPKDETIVEVKE